MSTQSSPQQNKNIDDASVAILWDMASCPVPSNMCSEKVAGNIKKALQVHPQINGPALTMFPAYGEKFPECIREGLLKAGVECREVSKGGKDSVDKDILADFLLFAVDNRPPAYIMLISSNDSFSQATEALCKRGYTVILALPSGVSSALRNAGSIVWDWPSLSNTSGLPRPDVDDDLTQAVCEEIEELLKRYVYGILSSCLVWLEESYEKKFKKPLEYESLGVEDIKELLSMMEDNNMVVSFTEPESNKKCYMSVCVVEASRDALKRNIQELFDKRGEILVSSFEVKYKEKFLVKLKYHQYGLTDLRDLCKVLNLRVELNELGEEVIKEVKSYSYNLRTRNNQ